MLTLVEYANAPFEEGGFDQVSDGLLALVPAGLIGFAVGLACMSVGEKQLTGAGRRALDEYVASAGHLTGAAHLVATRGLAAAHPDLRDQLIAASRVGRGHRMPVMAPPFLPHHDPHLWSAAAAVWCSSGVDSGGFACSGSGSGGGGGGSACSGGGGSACSGGGGGFGLFRRRVLLFRGRRRRRVLLFQRWRRRLQLRQLVLLLMTGPQTKRHPPVTTRPHAEQAVAHRGAVA